MTLVTRATAAGLALAAVAVTSGCFAGARRTPVVSDDDGDPDLSPALDLSPSPSLPDDLGAPLPPRDLSTTPPVSPRDLSTPTTLVPTDLAAPSAACTVRINEVATGTTASGYEEFIELYNPCSTAIDLRGWALLYRSAGGAANITIFNDIGKTIPSSGYLLFAGTGYYAATRDGVLQSGLAVTGGGVALVDGGGTVVDSVGWGTATNGFVQGGAAAAAPGDRVAPGRSIARSPDGRSTNRSAADFAITTVPTPKSANTITAP